LTAAVKVEGTPHPVGAGDACSAGILFGIAIGWNTYATTGLANRIGAEIAAHQSAAPELSNSRLNFARARLTGALPAPALERQRDSEYSKKIIF
jgi:hypothetical protein